MKMIKNKSENILPKFDERQNGNYVLKSNLWLLEII